MHLCSYEHWAYCGRPPLSGAVCSMMPNNIKLLPLHSSSMHSAIMRGQSRSAYQRLQVSSALDHQALWQRTANSWLIVGKELAAAL
jgi:hypothetical protein